MPPTPLDMFTIYDRPRDLPHGYVVRRWWITATGDVVPDPSAITNLPTLEDARRHIPTGYVRTARRPDDDLCIVETWV